MEPHKLVTYRHLQLVAALFNDVMKSRIMPVSIVGATTVLGATLAIVVSSLSKPGNFSFLLLMITVCAEIAFYLIFGLRGFGKVHDLSKHSLQTAKIYAVTMRGKMNRKWTRKFIKSCGDIRLKFGGGNNFVEILTSLNCISHAAQMSSQILLLGKK